MLKSRFCLAILCFAGFGSSCTTVEYGTGQLDVTSTPKKGTSDPVNHSIDILDHSAKN